MKTALRGFTLIELLVVIAIIGILSSVILASLNTAREKAYDARRESDLKEVQTALELYYSDHNGYPPTAAGSWQSQCVWGKVATANDVIPGLAPTYIAAVPQDPQMNISANQCCYLYESNGTDYKFIVGHECPTTNYESQPALVDPLRDGGTNPCTVDGTAPWAWSVYTPGAACW